MNRRDLWRCAGPPVVRWASLHVCPWIHFAAKPPAQHSFSHLPRRAFASASMSVVPSSIARST
eukprot:5263914-Prorocentrum_lima.AAC.1